MRIVILDGHALNPGDLSWDSFKELGDVDLYEETPSDKVVERAADADALIINKIVIDREILSALPSLRYVGITATGYNIVDLEALRERKVALTNVPAYSTDGVAQAVFAFILSFAERTAEYDSLVKSGKWSESGSFSLPVLPVSEISGKTLGIIGMGTIGMRVASIASAFGMNVIYSTRTPKSEAEALGYRSVSTDDLFRLSDYVSLHCPLTKDTENIVNERTLSLMKRDAVLINTARGALVDEKALYDALNEKRIKGAGMDVMRNEPPAASSPLFTLPSVIITPHIAWSAKETRARLLNEAMLNLKAFSEGRERNRIV